MLRAGQRILLRPENREAEVYRFFERGERYVVGLIFADTREAREFLFAPEELAERLEVLPTLVESFSRPEKLLPREQCLAFADALRMRLAYTFDPHYAVSVTQVDLLPHQVEAVYRYILPQPRVRFLLADDPGLGKTIMAGLVIKELKARGLVRRSLIVVPAHLLDQWQREMQEWFREGFTLLPLRVLIPCWNFQIPKKEDSDMEKTMIEKPLATRELRTALRGLPMPSPEGVIALTPSAPSPTTIQLLQERLARLWERVEKEKPNGERPEPRVATERVRFFLD